MSGLNYRGRQRLKDHGATERLRALLAAATDMDDEGAIGATDPEHPRGDAGHPPPARTDTEPLDPQRTRTSYPTRERAAAGGAGPGHRPDPDHLEVGPGPAGPRMRGERDSGGGGLHRQPVRVRHTLATPAAVVLAVVLLVVCAFAALSLTRGDPSAAPVLEATVRPDTAAPGEDAASGARATPAQQGSVPAGAEATAASAGTLTVHIAGQVRAPGVVEVSPGARVIDAVAAADGLTERAVTDRVNLAEPLSDGQQVVIPDRETADAVAAGQGPDSAAGTPGGSAGSRASVSAGPAPGAGTVNLNTATVAELETLPRVGPVLAQRIVDFRTQHGPFTAPEQLDDVSGIGPAMLEALLPLVTI